MLLLEQDFVLPMCLSVVRCPNPSKCKQIILAYLGTYITSNLFRITSVTVKFL